MSTQTASVSQGSTVVQIVGDGNSVVLGHPHLQLTRHLNRRQIRNRLDWLSPYTRSTALIGRDREMQELRTWLSDPRPILARVITGSGGRGKTRLALELCEWAHQHGWSAGFASRTEMHRFLMEPELARWGWQRPTLVVVDYAAQHSLALGRWIEELADRDEAPSQPLRLLLLERHASMQTGWCASVFAGGGFGDTSKRALLDPPEPVELAPLQSDAARLALLEDLRRRLAPGQHDGLAREESLLQQLRSNDWGGDPLYLMMAALSGEQLGDARSLALKRADLALELARREVKRIRERAAEHRVDPHLAVHLVACVTLAQGMDRDTFEAFTAAEKLAVRRPSGGDAAVLADLLQQLLPRRGRIAPIVPDLIGEAFVLASELDREAVLRCYAANGATVARTAIRCAQDFSPQRAEPLQWLEAIVGEIADQEEALDAMADALPLESVALADLTLRVAQRLATLRRGNSVPAERRVVALAHLAIAYANAGQREPALQAAQQAADLYRKLASRRPEIFRRHLAMSLNNLANMMSDLGRHEAALAAALEAADLYRKLAAQRPDVFRPDLASALNNLALMLSDLGQRERALQAAQEAADIRRELAVQRPEVFRPDLAGSLSNLALMLSDLDQREPALQTAEEAVGLYRELASQRPDVFQPTLAKSLGNLAGILRDLGEREPALQAAQEAVDLYRELAARRPDVFRADLSMSLNNLALMLSDLTQREPARQAAQEAVDLLRELAAQRPDVFRADLARSLSNLALMLRDLGHHQPAQQAAQQAIDLLRELAAQRPEVFRPELARSLCNLALLLKDLGQRTPAVQAAQEAVDLYGGLAAKRPEVFRSDLDRSHAVLTHCRKSTKH